MTPLRSAVRAAAIAAWTARLALALPLLAGVATAVMSPALAPLAKGAALIVGALTLWRPVYGLLLAAVLAPSGLLFEPFPATVVELFAWAFLSAWLLAIWRPLFPAEWRPPAFVAIGLFVAAIAASWLALALQGAAGVPVRDLPFFLASLIPADYLVFSSEMAATRVALQAAAGLGLAVAAAAAVSADRRLARAVAIMLVVSGVALTLATLAEIARLWAGEQYAAWFVLRYVYGERFTVAPGDLNAAGSLYTLALVAAAAMAWGEPARRWTWLAGGAIVVIGLLLAGSRSAFVATAAGLLAIAVVRRGWRLSRRHALASVAAIAGVLVVIAGLSAWRAGGAPNTAANALDQRLQFTQSTLDMIAAEPIYGVGVGQYFARSAEFFTPALRELYGNENAHNYFLQQFAELGIVGGVLFLAVVLVPMAAGWRAIRGDLADAPMLALGGAVLAYLITCVPGHPLLVPEMAMPFWVALGALAGGAALRERRTPAAASLAAIAIVLGALAGNVALAFRSYEAVTEPPAGYGFHETQVENGVSFRWMTREAAAYVADGPGFLHVTAMAPAAETPALPYVLEVSVAGRVVDRRELPPEEWVTYDIPIRAAAALPFRRVDLRVNQVIFEGVSLAGRPARRPLGVRIAELEWRPLE